MGMPCLFTGIVTSFLSAAFGDREVANPATSLSLALIKTTSQGIEFIQTTALVLAGGQQFLGVIRIVHGLVGEDFAFDRLAVHE
jgi:hypothetical protein